MKIRNPFYRVLGKPSYNELVLKSHEIEDKSLTPSYPDTFLYQHEHNVISEITMWV